MSVMVSQINGVSIVSSAVCWGANQRKHQSSASLAFVRGILRWPVDFHHKGPVTRTMFSSDDVIGVCCEFNAWSLLLLPSLWFMQNRVLFGRRHNGTGMYLSGTMLLYPVHWTSDISRTISSKYSQQRFLNRPRGHGMRCILCDKIWPLHTRNQSGVICCLVY